MQGISEYPASKMKTTSDARPASLQWVLLAVAVVSMVAVATADRDPNGVQLSGSVMLIGKFDWEVSGLAADTIVLSSAYCFVSIDIHDLKAFINLDTTLPIQSSRSYPASDTFS